jgi:hypothetical protein
MNYPNSKYKNKILPTMTSTLDNQYVEPFYLIWDKIKFYFQGKKLIKNWEKIFDIRIYDPDGWDRTDLYLFDRYYTKNEFEIASCYSTCEFGEESVNYLFKDNWDFHLRNTNIRWDILLLIFQQEEDRFLDAIDWTNLIRGSEKTETIYNLFRLYMKRKYDFDIPELFEVDWEPSLADENAYVNKSNNGLKPDLIVFDEYVEFNYEGDIKHE